MLDRVGDGAEAAGRGDAAEAGFASHYVIEGDAGAGLVLLCDHARNALPAEYGSLGLPASEFERHIAYDIGVEAVTRGLAARLRCPAAVSCFSRLLIDPNRGLDDPTLIMRLSDGAVVPGNARLDAAERQRRIERYWMPYHGAAARLIDAALAGGRRPVVVAVHSFTPFWKGVARPWHAGLLWDRDRRFSDLLMSELGREAGLVVAHNEPYSGGLAGDSIDQHATRHGLANTLIEIRQDLIAAPAGVAEWVDRLAAGLAAALRGDGLEDVFRPRRA